ASFVMPNVLSKLGAEVLSLNPYASTRQALSFSRAAHAEGVSRLVKASGAHLGAVIDPDGERLMLVDDRGHVLSDQESLLALLRLVLATTPKKEGRPAHVVLPLTVTGGAEAMCLEAGAKVELSKLSTSHLMEAASRPDVDFAAGPDGGFIFPAFMPVYDAVCALVNALGLLATSGQALSQVVAALPSGKVTHLTVATPQDKKGLVMRSVMDFAKGQEVVLVDGVKVAYPDGWALVLPDAEHPVTHVWAEARREADARARAQQYARQIGAWLDE
ncbi:MAG: mannose-1-phosphate guanyltransferase, partial [Acidimicrobiales bacterium]